MTSFLFQLIVFGRTQQKHTHLLDCESVILLTFMGYIPPSPVGSLSEIFVSLMLFESKFNSNPIQTGHRTNSGWKCRKARQEEFDIMSRNGSDVLTPYCACFRCQDGRCRTCKNFKSCCSKK